MFLSTEIATGGFPQPFELALHKDSGQWKEKDTASPVKFTEFPLSNKRNKQEPRTKTSKATYKIYTPRKHEFCKFDKGEVPLMGIYLLIYPIWHLSRIKTPWPHKFSLSHASEPSEKDATQWPEVAQPPRGHRSYMSRLTSATGGT